MSVCLQQNGVNLHLFYSVCVCDEHDLYASITNIPITIAALALVDVLGVFTSETGFCTPKIRRSDVL